MTHLVGFKPLGQVEEESYEDAFLIEDLLTSRITGITGEPKSGKSLFVAGMVRALIEGDPTFLGQQIHRGVDSVVYGFTDEGSDSELKSRLAGTAASRRVYVEPMFGMTLAGWADVRERVLTERPGLFVLDTMLGSLTQEQDISSNGTGQGLIAQVRPISNAGIPVLLVTHTPKGNAEGLSVSSSVIGSRSIAAGMRGVIALRKSKRGLRIATNINRATQDLNLAVTVEREREGSEVPRWSLTDTAASDASGPSVWQPRLVECVLSDQPAGDASAASIGDTYAPQLGVSSSTIRRAFRQLVEHDGEAWRAKAA